MLKDIPNLSVCSPNPEVINTYYFQNARNYVPSDKSILETLSFTFGQKLELLQNHTFLCEKIAILVMERNEVFDVTFKCPFNCVLRQ